MRKASIILILGGFVFVLFSAPLLGLDLLIDAVGYLFIWNGLRMLQKESPFFRLAIFFALILTGVAAVHLFLPNNIVLFFIWLICDLFLYVFMFRGFFILARTWDVSLLGIIGWIVCALCIFTILVAYLFHLALLDFFPIVFLGPLSLMRNIFVWIQRVSLIGYLLIMAYYNKPAQNAQ